jgi:hypothetical protein
MGKSKENTIPEEKKYKITLIKFGKGVIDVEKNYNIDHENDLIVY